MLSLVYKLMDDWSYEGMVDNISTLERSFLLTGGSRERGRECI